VQAQNVGSSHGVSVDKRTGQVSLWGLSPEKVVREQMAHHLKPLFTMEYVPSSESDIPSLKASDPAEVQPLSASPEPASTVPYIISPEEVTADAEKDSLVPSTRRAGSVFKGLWNNSTVAIKILSNGTPTDVRGH
jgi:hypothetical protein